MSQQSPCVLTRKLFPPNVSTSHKILLIREGSALLLSEQTGHNLSP